MAADPGACSFQFDPIGGNKFESNGCDIIKSTLAKAGASYTAYTRERMTGDPARVRIGTRVFSPRPIPGAWR